MKRMSLLAMLISVSSFAVAATAGADGAKQHEGAPHGGMTTTPGAALPPGHPQPIPADVELSNSGKVLDVLDSDMYTYVQVNSEKGPVWLAAYKTTIRKGATVKYSSGVAMSKFYSKALNRTFDLIVFVDRLEEVK